MGEVSQSHLVCVQVYQSLYLLQWVRSHSLVWSVFRCTRVWTGSSRDTSACRTPCSSARPGWPRWRTSPSLQHTPPSAWRGRWCRWVSPANSQLTHIPKKKHIYILYFYILFCYYFFVIKINVYIFYPIKNIFFTVIFLVSHLNKIIWFY